jgi:hypothetical protein
MKMSAETLAPGWRAIPLGPWERYRRDIDGGRRVIVARRLYGDWVWETWSVPDLPVCLDLGESATAEKAMADADRAAIGYAVLTDEELIARNGLDSTYAEVATLKVVAVGEGKRCVMCGNDIPPGLAAEERSGDGWLWCGSCACRNPGSVMADGVAATV